MKKRPRFLFFFFRLVKNLIRAAFRVRSVREIIGGERPFFALFKLNPEEL